MPRARSACRKPRRGVPDRSKQLHSFDALLVSPTGWHPDGVVGVKRLLDLDLHLDEVREDEDLLALGNGVSNQVDDLAHLATARWPVVDLIPELLVEALRRGSDGAQRGHLGDDQRLVDLVSFGLSLLNHLFELHPEVPESRQHQPCLRGSHRDNRSFDRHTGQLHAGFQQGLLEQRIRVVAANDLRLHRSPPIRRIDEERRALSDRLVISTPVSSSISPSVSPGRQSRRTGSRTPSCPRHPATETEDMAGRQPSAAANTHPAESWTAECQSWRSAGENGRSTSREHSACCIPWRCGSRLQPRPSTGPSPGDTAAESRCHLQRHTPGTCVL